MIAELNTVMGNKPRPASDESSTTVPVWRTAIDLPLMGSPALARVAGKTVAAFGFGGRSASNGGLLVLNADTGAIVWQFDGGSGVEGGAAIDGIDGTRALFGDQLGRMHCVDLVARAEVWQAQLEGAVVSAPLLAHDRVYVSTGMGVIACLDPASGREIRREKVASQLVSAQPVHLPQEPRPKNEYRVDLRRKIEQFFDLNDIRTLCYDLDINYENLSGGTFNTKVIALIEFVEHNDRLDDLVRWCNEQRPKVTWKSAPPPDKSPKPRDAKAGTDRQAPRISATPVTLLAGDVVAGALDGGVYAMQANQPGLTRLFDAGSPIYAMPIAWGNAGAPNVQMLIATYAGDVIAIDPGTGRQMWRVALGKPIRATPHLANKTLYLGTQGRTLHALDADSGREHWQMPWQNSVTTTPLVAHRRILFGDTQGRVVCLDEASRRIMWQFDAQSNRPGLDGVAAAVFGGFGLYNRHVLFGAHNGCAYSLKV